MAYLKKKQKLKMDIALHSAKGLIDSAIYLLDHIEDDEYVRNTNKYSFILVSSASLESLLNDGIITWALNTFPKDDHKRHATAFLSMNLGKKLDALGYLISAGKFITDNSNETYQIKCESIIKALKQLDGILSYEIDFSNSELLNTL